MKVLDPLVGGFIGKYRPIEADIVARAMLTAAQSLKSGVQTHTSKQLNQLALEFDIVLGYMCEMVLLFLIDNHSIVDNFISITIVICETSGFSIAFIIR